jgi:hypothetical protein
MEYTIFLNWDDEARVWVSESEDIPGLVLESGSLDALVEKVKMAVPDLLELPAGESVRLLFRMERLAVVA